MSMGYWLRKSLFPKAASATPGTRRRKAVGTTRAKRPRPFVETLEDRCLLDAQAPFAADHSYAMGINTKLTISAPGLLTGDLFVNANDIITVVGTNQLLPAHGQAVVNPDGSFTYTPNAGFTGTDTFGYRFTDVVTGPAAQFLPSNVGNVTITVVNDTAPVAKAESYSTPAGKALTVNAPGVLANDSDPDGQPLTAGPFSGSTGHGTVNLMADGSFTYTPTDASYNGPDSFTYQASDGTLKSAVTTVSLTVGTLNLPPTAQGDSYTINEGAALTEDAAGGVLHNDSDPDGKPLTAILVAGPSNGTLNIQPDGSFTYTPNDFFFGSDSFTYQASDGTLSSTTATVTITVKKVDHAPVAGIFSYITDGKQPLTVNAPGVLAGPTSFDPDGDAILAVPFTGSTQKGGSVTLKSDGSFTYTAPPSSPIAFTGSDSFTYQITDGTLTASGQVNIAVGLATTSPTAADDNYTTPAGTALTENAFSGILANDSYNPSDIIQPQATNPKNGSLTLNSDGSFTYTPNAGFSGTDSFTYSFFDATLAQNSTTATVTIKVVADSSIPTPVDDSASTDQNTPVAVNVLANDTYKTSDEVHPFPFTDPGHGSVTINVDNTLTYTPDAGFFGTDSFTYLLYDNTSNITSASAATVTITVNPDNKPPTAVDHSYTTPENTLGMTVIAPGVLADASDPNNQPLTAILVTGPSNGHLTLNSTGFFSYTPNRNFAGIDTFTYQAFNGTTKSNIAKVTINITAVSGGPVVADHSYITNENTQKQVDAPGVLDNATGTVGKTLTVTLVTGASHGTVALKTDGSFTYTPNANYVGPDSFTFQATDGTNFSNNAKVNLTVNAPPVATADSYTATESTLLSVLPSKGVLANDSDPDGGHLTAVLVAKPSHGTLTLDAAGSFNYTPDASYFGPDSFTYQAYDGNALSNIVTVSLTVNAPPTATDHSYTGGAGSNLSVSAAKGLLVNASDPDRDALTAQLVTDTNHGSVTVSADGSFTYTPDAGYNGSDSFTYQVSDGNALSNTATVSLNVTTDHAPTAQDDSYITNENGQLIENAALGVLGNDSSSAGKTLSAELFAKPGHGTLTLNADGSFTYIPNANYFGSDSFTYQASDGTLTSAIATVNITVTKVDQPPVAAPDSYAIGQDKTLTVAGPGVLGNDSDPEGDHLTAAVVAQPSHGNLNFQPDGSFTYTPAAGFTGTDSFTYQASDGTLTSAVTTVSIAVNAPNQPPTATADTYNINEGTPLTVTGSGVLANDSDPDGDSLSAVLVSGPSHGSLKLNADGSFTYTPDATFAGSDSFTYEAQDAKGALSNTAAVSISVINQAPQVAPGASAAIDQGNTFSGIGTITDAGADLASTTVDYGDGSGVQHLTLNGSTYVLNHRYTHAGAFTVTVMAQDSHGGVGTGNLTVTVQAAADEVLYVRRLYADLLNRDADAGGLTFWVQGLRQGVSRDQVADGIWRSGEHRGMQVDAYYNTYLHRASDPAGRDYWVKAFLAGATEIDIEQGFLTSGEYRATHTTDASYLAGLYQDVLGRTPDSAGLAYWTQTLQSLVSAGAGGRDVIARNFLTSGEAYLQVLDRYYADYLGRSPDSAGAQSWLNGLEHSAFSLESVAIGILSSDEYFHRS
jgi:VCBS repeat-containing protein